MTAPWRPRAAPGRRRGFTFVELMVTVALLLVLAALVLPSAVSALDARRVRLAARALGDFALAIHDPDSAGGSFRSDLGRYPGALSHLTRQITTSDVNGCGITYRPGDVIPDKWRGPYVNRVITGDGIPIGIGTALDDLMRDDPSNVRNSIMRIRVTDVVLQDAMALDERVDLGDGEAEGTVRWGALDGDGFVTLEYLLNVSGC